jgi:hypothetical protein
MRDKVASSLQSLNRDGFHLMAVARESRAHFRLER